jgi:uncharacterized protein (TIGR02266 family)
LLLTSGKESHKAGDVIFKEGSHGSAVYVLSTGKVEISKVVRGKKVVLDILGPGDVFGDMSYLDPAPRSATAVALEDTDLELLDRDFLDQAFNQIDSDFRRIICTLVRRLRKTDENLVYSPRRKEERLAVKIRISFKKATDFFKAYSANIGPGGFFIKSTYQTVENLPVGSLLDLEFNLPDSGHVIHTKGRVAWTRLEEADPENMPPGMGIEFIDMNPADRELLERYIAKSRSS